MCVLEKCVSLIVRNPLANTVEVGQEWVFLYQHILKSLYKLNRGPEIKPRNASIRVLSFNKRHFNFHREIAF